MDIELVFKVVSYLCGGISSVICFFKNLKPKRQEAKDKKRKEFEKRIEDANDEQSVVDVFDDIHNIK